VLLDEAHVDFADAQPGDSSIALLEEHPRLLVFRSFSKAWGLAGLRIGYALGAPGSGDLLAELACGYDDQRERRAGAPDDALEDRQRESAGLAGAGLRLGEEVAARTEWRYRELLDGREGGPAELLHSTVEIGGKRDQSISFAGNKKASRNVTRLACFLMGPSDFLTSD